MNLKLPVAHAQAHSADPQYNQALRTGWHDLMTLHGLPHGMFSADEDLHGNLSTQGTELCAIVETMFSLAQAAALTDEIAYLDALDHITYSTLPAQTTGDYTDRQYFQVVDRVQMARSVPDCTLPFDCGMSNVFGPYPGYTYCTANMHQGWVKFAIHLWYATPAQGVAALKYAPNTLVITINGTVPVTIRRETTYPFGKQVDFVAELKKLTIFPLALRLPAWCAEAIALLNGQPLRTDRGKPIITVARTWRPHDRLPLCLPVAVRTSNWPQLTYPGAEAPGVRPQNTGAVAGEQSARRKPLLYHPAPEPVGLRPIPDRGQRPGRPHHVDGRTFSYQC